MHLGAGAGARITLRTAAYAHALQRISSAVDATGSAETFRQADDAAEAL